MKYSRDSYSSIYYLTTSYDSPFRPLWRIKQLVPFHYSHLSIFLAIVRLSRESGFAFLGPVCDALVVTTWINA